MKNIKLLLRNKIEDKVKFQIAGNHPHPICMAEGWDQRLNLGMLNTMLSGKDVIYLKTYKIRIVNQRE